VRPFVQLQPSVPPLGGPPSHTHTRSTRPPPLATLPHPPLAPCAAEVQSAIHPDTGEVVPLVFRMSTFMPSNLPITAGMLLSGPGAAQVFWQWANQSYNAGFNYANRNASVPMDTKALALSYGVATGVACGMSYGLGRVVQRLQSSVGGGGGGGGGGGAAAAPQPLGLKLLTRGLPWLAVATAGVANVLAMRYKEGLEGITVYDEAGNAMGTSVAAGRACLTQVALTRAALPVPILLIPPFVLDGIRAYTPLGPLMARSLPARFGVELAVLSVFLQCALAPAVALFPPQGSLPASAMEARFQGRVSPTTGRPVEVYTYSKGV
jgi:hypothetical protein